MKFAVAKWNEKSRGEEVTGVRKCFQRHGKEEGIL